MRAPTPLIHLVLGAGLAAAALAAPQQASARDGVNGAILGGAAAGVLGGVAVGALLNGSAPPPPAYAPPPPRRVYVEPESTETIVVRERRPGPVCHMERRKVWLDSEEYTYKRVEVCE